MVFENFTLFELHLENSRFGPRLGGRNEASDDSADEEAELSDEEAEGGRGIGRTVGVLFVVAIVAALAVRRYRSESGDEDVEGVDEDTDQITIEHAADQ